MKKIFAPMLLLVLCFGACTSQATRLAIRQYEVTEQAKQTAFDNVARIAEEQMLLNLDQYTKAHSDPQSVHDAIVATFKARHVLEDAKLQYTLGRDLNRMTVGQYLYDQQGPLNVIFESEVATFEKGTGAAVAASDAAGVNSVKDIIAPLVPTSQPATQPSKDDLINRLQGLLKTPKPVGK